MKNGRLTTKVTGRSNDDSNNIFAEEKYLLNLFPFASFCDLISAWLNSFLFIQRYAISNMEDTLPDSTFGNVEQKETEIESMQPLNQVRFLYRCSCYREENFYHNS